MSDQIISLVGVSLASRLSGRNLGVTFNQDQSLNSHMTTHYRNAFLPITKIIAKIKNMVIQNVKLAHVFNSGFDYHYSRSSGWSDIM